MRVSESLSATISREGFEVEVGLTSFERKTDSTIDKALFHVVNLTGLNRRESVHSRGASSTSKLVISGGGWNVELQFQFARRTNSGFYERFSEQREFAVTYFGILEKVDHSHFGADEASDIFEGLYYFLSFVRGAWCLPCLYIGVSSSDFRWLRCTQPKDINHLNATERRSFTFTGSEVVVSACFAGFLDFWNDPEWRTPLKTALSWAIDGRQSRSIDLILWAARLRSN
jgi:hypothetical protein